MHMLCLMARTPYVLYKYIYIYVNGKLRANNNSALSIQFSKKKEKKKSVFYFHVHDNNIRKERLCDIQKSTEITDKGGYIIIMGKGQNKNKQ